jgi:hypothetical protein
MALPITIPNTFANATVSIPLSQLDQNFTVVRNAINGIGSGAVALANVNVTGGSVANATITNGTQNNTRINPRVVSITTAANITPTGNTADQYNVTALASDANVEAPSGTPSNGQKLIIRIKDNGISRNLTWDAIYRVIGSTLPIITISSKTVYVGCIWNNNDSVWDVVGVAQEA